VTTRKRPTPSPAGSDAPRGGRAPDVRVDAPYGSYKQFPVKASWTRRRLGARFKVRIWRCWKASGSSEPS